MAVPVLICNFNRPAQSERVLHKVLQYKPSALFLHFDGPRLGNLRDQEKCAGVRAVFQKNKWPCPVKKRYAKNNLGCGRAVFGALEWFFQHVPEGIILEDDCLPESGFFPFAEAMLQKYRDDNTVMHISGMGFRPKGIPHEADGFFSAMPFIWGWASWRRAWNFYKPSLPRTRDLDLVLRRECKSELMRRYWQQKLLAVKRRQIRTWDYQWVYTLWSRGGWAVTPTTSLITNIGFGRESTHTLTHVKGYAPTGKKVKAKHLRIFEKVDRTHNSQEIFDRIFLANEPKAGLERFFRKPGWLWILFLGIRRRVLALWSGCS